MVGLLDHLQTNLFLTTQISVGISDPHFILIFDALSSNVAKLQFVAEAKPMQKCKPKLKSRLTSNDIIAGNGRILSVHEYCVV